MTAGPRGALCVTVAAPVMGPVTFGVKVTLNVHLPPAAKVAPQPFCAMANGAAVAKLLEILKLSIGFWS